MKLIYAYTRADALKDGLLIDCSKIAKEAGFSCPVAISKAAWEDAVAWSDAANKRKRLLQSEEGRLWDVVWMAAARIRGLPKYTRNNGSGVAFIVHRTPRKGRYRRAFRKQLKVLVHPGDDHEVVATILEPDED